MRRHGRASRLTLQKLDSSADAAYRVLGDATCVRQVCFIPTPTPDRICKAQHLSGRAPSCEAKPRAETEGEVRGCHVTPRTTALFSLSLSFFFLCNSYSMYLYAEGHTYYLLDGICGVSCSFCAFGKAAAKGCLTGIYFKFYLEKLENILGQDVVYKM